MIKQNHWLPVYTNKNYLVNWVTGEVKSLRLDKIIMGNVMRRNNGEIKAVKYVLKDDENKRHAYYGQRLVAEAVLQKDLSKVSIIHKNGMNSDNAFNNLDIGKIKLSNCGYRVFEYKNNEFNKIYKSIADFERKTGISAHTLRKYKGIYSIGQYRWEREK